MPPAAATAVFALKKTNWTLKKNCRNKKKKKKKSGAHSFLKENMSYADSAELTASWGDGDVNLLADGQNLELCKNKLENIYVKNNSFFSPEGCVHFCVV